VDRYLKVKVATYLQSLIGFPNKLRFLDVGQHEVVDANDDFGADDVAVLCADTSRMDIICGFAGKI